MRLVKKYKKIIMGFINSSVKSNTIKGNQINNNGNGNNMLDYTTITPLFLMSNDEFLVPLNKQTLYKEYIISEGLIKLDGILTQI